MRQGSLIRMLEDVEKKEMMKALRDSGWVKARAARALGLTERMLDYRIKKYGLSRDKEKCIASDGELAEGGDKG